MLSNPRNRGAARLAAGSVLAATALASGSFAALGVTAAHADASNPNFNPVTISVPNNGPASPDSAAIDVAETPQLNFATRISLTLHNVVATNSADLMVQLVHRGPAGDGSDDRTAQVLCDPATLGGLSTPNGVDVTFTNDANTSSDHSGDSGEPTCIEGALGSFLYDDPAGQWLLYVSSNGDSSSSDSATIGGYELDFGQAPSMTDDQQPQEQAVDSGTDAVFSAAAEGVPAPSVQWQESTDGGDTFADIPGATGNTYTVSAPTTADDRHMYQAVFTSTAGKTTSWTALLRVNGTAPKVTQPQPVEATVLAGTTRTFTASATGDPAVTYVRWEKSTDNGTTYEQIPGATTASYTVVAATLADSGLYRAVFGNDVNETATSPAKLTVNGTTPSAPRNVTATQTGPGTVTVRWTAPLSSGTPAINAYSIGESAGESGNGEGVGSTVRSDTWKSLAPGKYVMSVAAINAAGSSTRVFVPVTVVAPTKLPIANVSAKHVIAGTKFVLSGTGPKNVTLTVQRAVPGKAFVKLTTVKTNGWGAYSIAIPAVHTMQYRVLTATTKVSNKVTVTAAYAVHVQTVRTAARAYTIKGWITPAAAGRTVHVTATVAGKLVKIATLTTSSKGQYATHYKFAKTGPVTLHVTVSSSAQNAAGALNRALTVS